MQSSAIGSGMGPSGNTAVWNAIASMKATSPFDSGSSASSDIAGEFDSLIDTSASDALDGNASSAPAASASGSASGGQLQLLRQMQNAEQSTIDLYA